VRVLVVEDEVKLAALIRKALREQGMLADVAVKGEDALWMAGASPYDVIVLDVNLPGIDGFETCRRLRAATIATPILMLTARDAVEDRINGLNTGATTTSSSRSRSASCSPGCTRSRAARRRRPTKSCGSAISCSTRCATASSERRSRSTCPSSSCRSSRSSCAAPARS